MSKSKLGRFAVLSALLIAHTPVLADDTPDLKAYKRYVVGMHSFLCGATDCRDIHVLVVPHEADWSGTSAGQLRLNTLVDNVPVDSILWQASEDTFSSRYQKFSDNIDYKPRDVSAADQAASDTAQKDYIRLQTRYASSFKANTPSWNLFNAGQGALPEPQRKNRNQWADEFAPNESAARDQKVAAQQKRDSAIQRIYTGQVGEWLKKAKSPSLINAGDDAGNQREIYPFLVGDSLSTWIQNSSEALKGDDWQPQQTLTVTSSINTVEFEQKSGGLTLGVQIGYFGADLQGKRMSFSRHLTSSNATFQLAFGRLKEFAITPGNWYQPG